MKEASYVCNTVGSRQAFVSVRIVSVAIIGLMPLLKYMDITFRRDLVVPLFLLLGRNFIIPIQLVDVNLLTTVMHKHDMAVL